MWGVWLNCVGNLERLRLLIKANFFSLAREFWARASRTRLDTTKLQLSNTYEYLTELASPSLLWAQEVWKYTEIGYGA
jgi:hypothetical protein